MEMNFFQSEKKTQIILARMKFMHLSTTDFKTRITFIKKLLSMQCCQWHIEILVQQFSK